MIFVGLVLWQLTPLSTIFQLYYGGILLVEETGVPRGNHRHVGSHWQTLSHNVVSSTPRHERRSNLHILLWSNKSDRIRNNYCWTESAYLGTLFSNSTDWDIQEVYIILNKTLWVSNSTEICLNLISNYILLVANKNIFTIFFLHIQGA